MLKLKTSNPKILLKSTDETPLHFASENGFVEIAKSIIDAGADINAKNE